MKNWCGAAWLAGLAFATIGSPARAQAVFSVVHGFTGSDGAYPNAPVVAGPGGVLYGTTVSGGGSASAASGAVYRLAPSAGGWKETVLHAFAGLPADGALPHSQLLVGRAGVLYGTTGRGGRFDSGIVYRLTPPATGRTGWSETILYTFTGGDDGANPESEVVADAAGCLYGTALSGGLDELGSVYRLCPPDGANAWRFSRLYSFSGPDGAAPYGGLAARTLGGVFTLFGTASAGGAAGQGTVFSLSAPKPGQSQWRLSTLHAFSGQGDGAAPLGALWADGALNLYGTASQGGLFPVNVGVPGGLVFKLAPSTPPGAGPTTWSEHVLHRFAGGSDGIYPTGGVVEGKNGHLFGVTVGAAFAGCTVNCGTVFELAPLDDGGERTPWYERVLHRFTGRDGNLPSAALTPVTQPLSGALSLYGVAELGGAGGVGTVFKATP